MSPELIGLTALRELKCLIVREVCYRRSLPTRLPIGAGIVLSNRETLNPKPSKWALEGSSWLGL